MEDAQWQIMTQIGGGATNRIYSAENRSDRRKYVIKLISDKEDGLKSQEISLLSNIDHESIIRFKECVSLDETALKNSEVEEIYKSSGTNIKGYAMEYAARGDLLSLIQNLQMLPEIVARSYAAQLVNALEYLHDQRIAHRNLTLESLLLDEHFCLKLAGFGSSEVIREGETSTGKTGTDEWYLAPEMLMDRDYDAFSADIFAVGVIIFELVCGYSPFSIASVDDELYSLIIEERWEEFWAVHEEINPRNPILLTKGNLRELIERILCPNPERRATIEDIKSSQWMKALKVDRMSVESWILEIAKKQKSSLLLAFL